MENTTYDPSKPYSWLPDQSVDLKGNEFGMLFNTLASVVSSPGFQEDLDRAHRTIATQRLHQVMTQVMQRAVETGQVTEAPAAEQPVSGSMTAETSLSEAPSPEDVTAAADSSYTMD